MIKLLTRGDAIYIRLRSSEAFAMHDTWCTFLVIFRLLDPHGFKALHGGQNSSTEPRTVLSVGRGVHNRLKVRWRQCLNFLLHARLHALEHCASTCQNDVLEQVLPDVFLALDDCVIRVLMDAVLIVFCSILKVPGVWLEENLGAL